MRFTLNWKSLCSRSYYYMTHLGHYFELFLHICNKNKGQSNNYEKNVKFKFKTTNIHSYIFIVTIRCFHDGFANSNRVLKGFSNFRQPMKRFTVQTFYYQFRCFHVPYTLLDHLQEPSHNYCEPELHLRFISLLNILILCS